MLLYEATSFVHFRSKKYLSTSHISLLASLNKTNHVASTYFMYSLYSGYSYALIFLCSYSPFLITASFISLQVLMFEAWVFSYGTVVIVVLMFAIIICYTLVHEFMFYN